MEKGIVIGLIFLFLAGLVAAASNESSPALIAEPAKPEAKPLSFNFSGRVSLDLSFIKAELFWLKTRDYMSAGRNLFKWIMSLSLAAKIAAAVLFLILLAVIWNYTIRNSRANNLRRARKHHLQGEKAHRNGREEKAKYHYERARHYREKAQEQW
jgi:hypothetical protein